MSDNTTASCECCSDSAPVLRQMIQWREQYVSAALNQKFSGILTPGVYRGFVLSPSLTRPRTVTVGHGAYGRSLAVVERDGYSITVCMTDGGDVTLPAVGRWYVCVEAYYVTHAPGYQRIVCREEPDEHHVVIGVVTVTDADALLTNADIDMTKQVVATLPSMKDIDELWTELAALTDNRRAAWTTEEDVAEGGLLTLPGGAEYVPGRSVLHLSWDGINCHEGRQYAQTDADADTGRSATLRMLFPVPAGSEMEIVVHGGRTDDFRDGTVESIQEHIKQLERAMTGIQDDVRDTDGSAIEKANKAMDEVDDLADRVAYVYSD